MRAKPPPSDTAGHARIAPDPRRRRFLRAGIGAAALGAGGVSACASLDAAAGPVEARFPPQGRFIEIDGVRMHLLDRGPKDATALVLIHGASGNLRDFGFGFSEPLLERYRVIAIDRPGHGHSERGPGEAWRPDAQARLMRGAVAALGVSRAILLGHSLGCAPALAWALDAPDSAIGVVDLAGAAMPWPGGAGFLYELAATPVLGHLASNAISAFISEDYLEQQVARIFAPQSPPPGYLTGIGAPLAARADTLRYNGRDISELKAFLKAQSQRYPSLRPPLRIVHGLADKIVPARVHAEPLAALAPRAQARLLPGIGHMPHHAAREEVWRAIDEIAAEA